MCNNSHIIIEASGLVRRYRIDGGELEVLSGVSLTLRSGESVAIVGPSGAGKSTLLHLLGLLERPSEGKVSFEQRDSTGMSEQEMAALRLERIGFVFQFHHLLREFTAVENVLLPGLMRGIDRARCVSRARKLLEKVGLPKRFDHKPGELSGGEQQRVALARALMNNPSVILADEPTGNLDRKASEQMHNLLWELCHEEGTAVLLVTHDEALANQADRVFQLVDGRFTNN